MLEHSSHVPEDEGASATGFLQINPSSDHQSSTGNDHRFVSMDPARGSRRPSLFFSLVRLLADRKANSNPPGDSPVRGGNRLDEAEQGISRSWFRIAVAVDFLEAIEVEPFHPRLFATRDDVVARLGPKCTGLLDLDF